MVQPLNGAEVGADDNDLRVGVHGALPSCSLPPGSRTDLIHFSQSSSTLHALYVIAPLLMIRCSSLYVSLPLSHEKKDLILPTKRSTAIKPKRLNELAMTVRDKKENENGRQSAEV